MHGPDHLQTAMRCFLVEKSGEISTNWKGKFDITFQDRLCMLLF